MSEGASSPVDLREMPAPAAAPAKRSLVYYGWAMVAVAAVAMVATLPGRTHGLGMITERLLKDPALGLTRTSYGVYNLWATLIGALFCLGCGRLIDRLGVRSVLTVVLVLLGLAVWSMTSVGGIIAFFILLTLTRGFGQSALSVVSLSIVGKWFVRRINWAMALFSVLMTIGFVAAFQIGRRFADEDWRVVWGALGAIVFFLAPVAWLVTRNSPESIGLLVDGRRLAEGERSMAPDAQLSSTLGQAMRTPAFWVFGITTSLYGLISSGMSLFNESILVERGFPKEKYYEVAQLGMMVGLAANFLAGWLASNWSIARLTAIALAALAGAMVWLTFVTSDTQLNMYVIVYAVSGSIITVVFFGVWAKCYGRTHLGRIQGAAQMMTVFASAVGPLLFGVSNDRLGSYTPMLWILAGCTAVLAVVAWFTPVPTLIVNSPIANSPETFENTSR